MTEPKPYTSFVGTTEIRVMPTNSTISTNIPGVIRSSVSINVGGTYVELTGIEAERLGRELIRQAERPVEPSVAALYGKYMSGEEIIL